MSGILTSILAFCAAIGLLVAIHELGHFAAARALGIKVLRFSIGFGRPVWRFRPRRRRRAGETGHSAGETEYSAGETEYVVSAIPLGGYVKLLDERESDVPAAELHRAFNRQPIASRTAVLVAGPGANFLFAFVAYWLMFVAGVPGTRPIIGEVAGGSVAEAAGLRSQDEIVAVDREPVATWEGALLGLLDGLLDDGRIELELRDRSGAERVAVLEVRGREAELTEPGALLDGLGFAPFVPELPAVIGEVVEDEPAARAGLEPGDRIVSADEVAIASWGQWVEFVRARPGREVTLTIERDGIRSTLRLAVGSAEIDGAQRGRIGAAPAVPEGLNESLRAEQRYGPVAAMTVSLARTWEMSALTVRMLWRMVLGDVSVKNISGPINIAQYAGYTASAGFAPFLNFLAVVSLSLGILNLMPIPLLDGGQLLYQLIEVVKGSPVSERAQLFGQQIGIAVLLLIMSLAFYNDISRLVG